MGVEAGPVVVTGANGFIASWIVKDLLERGYHVRGTVRNPHDTSKVGHIQRLPGAQARLVLYQADLLAPGAYDSVLDGAQGVFHTASPVLILQAVADPKKDLIDPAVEGTLNLLRSALKHSSTVKRVVLTSSIGSVIYNAEAYNPEAKQGLVMDESWWSDVEWNRERGLWYNVSKTLAEKEAWDFVEKEAHGAFKLVAVHPGFSIGECLQDSVNATSSILLSMLNGTQKKYINEIVPGVDVRDVALAHVLAFENPAAEGRYICSERSLHFGDFAALLKKMYPQYPVPTEQENEAEPKILTYTLTTEKLQKLGLKFTPIEDAISVAVEHFRARKLLD